VILSEVQIFYIHSKPFFLISNEMKKWKEEILFPSGIWLHNVTQLKLNDLKGATSRLRFCAQFLMFRHCIRLKIEIKDGNN
jgi:hypothetical protein